MKIWYEHPYGRLDKYDIQLCKVYAEVEPEEGELALSQGFIDLDTKWQQMRSTRINIDEYVKQQPKYKQRKGVSVEKWKGSFAQKHVELLEPIYDQYIEHNNFTSRFPFNSYELKDSEVVWCYYYENQLCAWSIWSKYGKSIDNWQFAWDYKQPSLHLGKFSMYNEIHEAHKKEYKWFYLGGGYDNSCKWKANIPGFEWWTGKKWSNDTTEYLMHIKADLFVEDLEDLENVYTSIYGLNKPNTK